MELARAASATRLYLHVDFCEGQFVCARSRYACVRFLINLLGVLSSDTWITSLLVIG